jgi:hypothetical protein
MPESAASQTSIENILSSRASKHQALARTFDRSSSVEELASLRIQKGVGQ